MFLVAAAVGTYLELRKAAIVAGQEDDLRQLVKRYEHLAENAMDAQQRGRRRRRAALAHRGDRADPAERRMSTSGDGATPAVPTPAVPVRTATMRAVVQDGYGPPESLELREVPVPVPAGHEVLVEVRASSLNAADWHVALGEPYVARPALGGLRAPAGRIQGRDLAGRVADAG